MKNKIIIATSQLDIEKAVSRFEDYEIIDIVNERSKIETSLENNPGVNMILVSEGLSGNEMLSQMMINISKNYPNVRIVYLAGSVNYRDSEKVNMLGVLVMSGIYDIITEKMLTISLLKQALDHPKSYSSVKHLTKGLQSKSSDEDLIQIELPTEEDVENKSYYDNVFIFSSIKPGVGKSFCSVNVATALAEYGVPKGGKKLKVALIEADLQNLSVGTLLQIEDDKKNLKTVMDKIQTIFSESGKFIGTNQTIEETNSYIMSCFKSYELSKELKALVGSQLSFQEIENIKAHFYIYLVEAIVDEFDVIIIDSNSSLSHVTTFPLLQLAKTCYYVLNLDFNNVRNNVRYHDTLKEIGIGDKVKYILNEDIKNEGDTITATGADLEPLVFTSEMLEDIFTLEAKIPLIPKTVFLNRVYKGEPVVLDNKKQTLEARYQILKIANQIHPIENFSNIEEEAIKLLESNKKKGLFGFSK